MNSRIILSIPTILGYIGLFVNWFPKEMNWFVPNIISYETLFFIICVLTILQLFFLLKILWSFNKINDTRKWNWTWLLLIFSLITTFIFIWKTMDEMDKQNKLK